MQNSFEPHEIALFRKVIDVVCAEMGGCDTETETYIALRILSRAQSGEWDLNALLSTARIKQSNPYARTGESVH